MIAALPLETAPLTEFCESQIRSLLSDEDHRSDSGPLTGTERLFSVLLFKKESRALPVILDATLAIHMWMAYHAPEEVGADAPSVLRATRDV